MENIFISLSKYHPRETSNPKENHFTEAFAYILRENPQLANNIIETIVKKKHKKISLKNLRIMPSQISTQQPMAHYSAIADMKITMENKLLVLFEHKIDATEHYKQLDKYISELNKEESIKQKFLFYITKDYQLVEQAIRQSDYYYEARWKDIYDIVKQYSLKVNGMKRQIIEQFIEYMEAENMKKYNTLKRSDFDMGEKYEEFVGSCKQSLAKVTDYVRSKDLNVRPINDPLTSANGLGIVFSRKKLKASGIKGGIGYWYDSGSILKKDRTLFLCIWFSDVSILRPVCRKNGLKDYGGHLKNWLQIFEPVKYILGSVKPERQEEAILKWFKEHTKGILEKMR